LKKNEKYYDTVDKKELKILVKNHKGAIMIFEKFWENIRGTLMIFVVLKGFEGARALTQLRPCLYVLHVQLYILATPP
jgi:hypothetical protein